MYSVHRFSISRSSVRHFPERCRTVAAFPCFTVNIFFHELVCPLTVVLPKIFFRLTTLFAYPVFYCLFHAPLAVVVFLVFLRSFMFESFLSRSSPFVAQIKHLCSDPFFFFRRCLPRITLAISATAVLKLVIIESMSVSSLFMMVRGGNSPLFMAWKVSNILGSFNFSRSDSYRLWVRVLFVLLLISKTVSSGPISP